jgi:hypothetical protein
MPDASSLARTATPVPPDVAAEGPPGAFLVELLISNGAPFKDHWAYWVRSHSDPNIGVKIHATGDVRNGFIFEVQRSLELDDSTTHSITRIPLQWIDGRNFDETVMLNNGQFKLDTEPVCAFEVSAYKTKAPGKSLITAGDMVSSASH